PIGPDWSDLRIAAIRTRWQPSGQIPCNKLWFASGVHSSRAGAVDDDYDNRIRRTSCRPARRSGGGRRHDLFDHHGAQFLAFPQRHDPVVAARALSDAEKRLRAQLRADRPDYTDPTTGL